MVDGVSRMEVRAHNVKFGADAKKDQSPENPGLPETTPNGEGLGKLNELISTIVSKAISEKLGEALGGQKDEPKTETAYTGDDCPL